MSGENPRTGFGSEVRLILKRARDVWDLVSRQHRLALGAAAVVMALSGASNTFIALLLGRLVDPVIHAGERGHGRDDLLRSAALTLGLIGAVYVGREGLNVVRRYLVENTC